MFSLVFSSFCPQFSQVFGQTKNNTSGSDLAGQIFLEAGAPHVVAWCEDAGSLKMLVFRKQKW